MDELIRQLQENRKAVQDQIDAGIYHVAAREENRGKVTAEEDQDLSRLLAERDQMDDQLQRYAEAKKREDAAAAKRREFGLGEGTGAPAHITNEPRTYNRESARRNETSWVRDIAFAMAFPNHPLSQESAQRLQQHGREVEIDARDDPRGTAADMLRRSGGRPAGPEAEVRVGLTTVAGAGGTFVPPIYLIDQYVPYLRASRPFADAVTNMQLPAGTDSINIPKVTAGTAVAAQATQNTAVQETDLTDAYLTAPVATEAGQQIVSLQLLEQSPIAFDEVVMQDLIRALAVLIDSEAWNGPGSGGRITGLLNIGSFVTIAYTSATPSPIPFLSKLHQAIGTVHNTLYRPPTHIFMTPLRWAWLLAATDQGPGNTATTGRPLVVPAQQGPFNAAAIDTTGASQGFVGTVNGFPCHTDPNMPANLGAGTNQDPVVVVSAPDIFLWEGALTTRALPQTLGNQLSVIFQLYEYIAYMANRYTQASAAVNGTGTIAPLF